MYKYLSFLAAFFGLFFSSSSAALQDTGVYCFDRDGTNPIPYIQVLRDPQRSTELQQVVHSLDLFQPSGKTFLDFGGTSDRFWFKLDISNCSLESRELIFSTGVVRFGLFKVFEITAGNITPLLDTSITGSTLESLQRHGFISFPISIQPAESRSYLIRFEAANNSALPFSVTEEVKLLQKQKSRERKLAAILGTLGALVLFNAVLFVFTRMPVFGHYVIIQLVVWVYIMHIAGWSIVYLWGDGPFDKSATGLLAASITTMIPVFTREFYKEELRSAVAIKRALGVTVLGGVVFLALKILNLKLNFLPGTALNGFGYFFGNAGMLISLASSAWYTVRLRVERSAGAWSNLLFTFAWLLMTANVLLMAFRSMALLRMTDDALIQFGYIAIVESSVLAMSLALRVRQIYVEREDAVMAQLNTEKAAEEVGRMILAVGHDSRQLLTAMGSYCDLILTKVVDTRGEKLAHDMKRLANLLADVMSNAIEGAEHDRLSTANLRASEFAVNRVFAPLDLIYKNLAKDNDVSVRYAFHEGQVCCDRVILLRILGNLLSNAIQYSNHGQVLVSVRMRRDCVLYQIRDTGPGIKDSAVRAALNERMSAPAAHNADNLGIGLKGAFDMAEALNASLSLRGQENQGTCASLSIPRL